MKMPPIEPPAKPDSPEERLAANVARLTRGWFKLGREDARQLGLSPPKVFLLLGLEEDGPVPATRWAERTGATPPAMSALLDGLEEDGYITRTHARTDRRQVLIALSPKGRKLAETLRARFRARWRSFCAGIPDSRLQAAAVTMGRIAARMDELEELAGVGFVPAGDRRKGS